MIRGARRPDHAGGADLRCLQGGSACAAPVIAAAALTVSRALSRPSTAIAKRAHGRRRRHRRRAALALQRLRAAPLFAMNLTTTSSAENVIAVGPGPSAVKQRATTRGRRQATSSDISPKTLPCCSAVAKLAWRHTDGVSAAAGAVERRRRLHLLRTPVGSRHLRRNRLRRRRGRART